MNSIERIKAAIGNEKADRVAVIPQIFGHAAVVAGVPLRAYLRDGDTLARCQLQALKRYGHDALFALMDTSVETEALGSVLNYPQDRYPYVQSYALADVSGLQGLAVPDPRQAGRMPELLKAAGLLRREVGDDVLVVGCVLGPMTVAVQLLGMEKALFLAIDQPEQFGLLLDFACDVSIRFGTAQIEAGVHLPLVFDPAATPDVIPPQFFREFELPRLERLFAAFKEAGSLANWLHVAGPTAPIIPFYPHAGVEIANFDYGVDPLEQTPQPRTCFNGNIKSLSFVYGSAEAIFDESSRLLRRFERRGGFILSSGCEIPPEARPENVDAMVTSVLRR